jgi:hypothetical protein
MPFAVRKRATPLLCNCRASDVLSSAAAESVRAGAHSLLARADLFREISRNTTSFGG